MPDWKDSCKQFTILSMTFSRELFLYYMAAQPFTTCTGKLRTWIFETYNNVVIFEWTFPLLVLWQFSLLFQDNFNMKDTFSVDRITMHAPFSFLFLFRLTVHSNSVCILASKVSIQKFSQSHSPCIFTDKLRPFIVNVSERYLLIPIALLTVFLTYWVIVHSLLY